MAATKKTTENADVFENLTTINPEAFKQGYEKFAQNASVFADFNKGAMEAFMASAGAFAKGVEKLTSENAAFAKAAFEETTSTAKAAASSKSVQEAVELNSDFVRASMEKNLGQVNKVADIWMEMTKNTTEPLTAHYSELVEKIQTYRP